MDKKTVFYYVYDKRLIEISRNIPNIGNRAAVVQSLIAAYDLFLKCELCCTEEATDEDLMLFHSSGYIDCLKKAQSSTDLEKLTDSEECTDFNLGYDCPLFENIYNFVKLIAGSSLGAAKKLVSESFQIKRKVQCDYLVNSKPKSYLKFKNGLKLKRENDLEKYKEENDIEINGSNLHSRIYEVRDLVPKSNVQPICINWFGGWHHAQRDEAEGFCYVNDIVIAIQYLLKFFKKILYVDLDVHHGNGVENAFTFSQRVLTLSLHKFETGFYPATGSLNDIGNGNGKFYSVNVPLKSGITDDKYIKVFEEIASKIQVKYKPQCVVVQCGADCLAGDPLGGFNMTPMGMGRCLKYILNWKLPTLILGGGGYNTPNVARCWAYLTSVIVDCDIYTDIPDNSFFHLYGPGFELTITPTLRKDENTDDYLQTVVKTILHNLDNIS